MALPSSIFTRSAALATGIPRKTMTFGSSPVFGSPASKVQARTVPASVAVNEVVMSRGTSRNLHTTRVRHQKKPMKQYYDKAEAMMRRTTDEMAAKLRAAKKKRDVPSERGQARPRLDDGEEVMDDRDKTVMKASAALVFLVVVIIVASKVFGAKETGEAKKAGEV